MARYIDADKLNLDAEVEMADDWKTAHEIANVIKYAPAEDVTPVVHAKWEIESTWEICGMTMTTSCRCSNCKHLHHWHQEESAFCPNCGAKMEKE